MNDGVHPLLWAAEASGGSEAASALAVISLLTTVALGVYTARLSGRLEREKIMASDRQAEQQRDFEKWRDAQMNEFTLRQNELERQQLAATEAASRAAVARQYSEPLVSAAIGLYGRLKNIAAQSFLPAFLVDGSPHEKRYARTNTLYQIAQYFGWVEVLRREVQYLAPGDEQRERALQARLDTVSAAFSTDGLSHLMLTQQLEFVEALQQEYEMMMSDPKRAAEPRLRLFRGEQRALGELVVQPADAAAPGAPRFTCMGYAEFDRLLGEDEVFASWFKSLDEDLVILSTQLQQRGTRLVVVQAALVQLINELDPDGTRSPHHARDVAPLRP